MLHLTYAQHLLLHPIPQNVEDPPRTVDELDDDNEVRLLVHNVSLVERVHLDLCCRQPRSVADNAGIGTPSFRFVMSMTQ